MDTPGSTAAHQLKGLPAFFSPSTRSQPKNGGGEEGTVEQRRELGRVGCEGSGEKKERKDHRGLPRKTCTHIHTMNRENGLKRGSFFFCGNRESRIYSLVT